MTRNEKYWIDRANRRMDKYVASAFDEARIINRAYSGLRTYIDGEMAKILRHIGDEDSLAYEYRMKRLNALLKNTDEKFKELYNINLGDTTAFLKSIIPEAYYHTIFDIAQGIGAQPEFSAVNSRLINKIIHEDWSGENYSKRIWKNTNKLAEEVREVLTEAATNGESIYKTSAKVADKFNTSAYNAERLIRTETTYAANQAEMLAYDELEIEKYEFVATLDTRTSPICQKMDGKVFETKEAQAGKNLPAMHPNCRSTTIPYFKDGMPTVRTARDKDGNRITVPANMKYDEWYDKYIEPTAPKKQPKPKTEKPVEVPTVKPAEIQVSKAEKGGYAEEKILEKKFTPAQTKEEAVEYAHKFAKDVNYDGISLENVNIINETLTELTEKYPINQLAEINNKTRGRATMSANHEQLNINGKALGKTLDDCEKNFIENQKAAQSYIDLLKDRYKDKAVMPDFAKKAIAKSEKELKFSRWSVNQTAKEKVKATVMHEYGHILADQYFGQINRQYANPNYKKDWNVVEMSSKWDRALMKARKTGDIYNLSEYGSKNSHEFFAECFAARECGEKLPDYVESLMSEVLSNGIM